MPRVNCIYQVTPTNHIDLSLFLCLGQNVIEIYQTAALEDDVVFALHAHFPTRAQMKEVEKKRQMDAGWEAWRKRFLEPLNIEINWEGLEKDHRLKNHQEKS